MDAIFEFLRNLKERFGELTQGQKTAAVILSAVIIGSILVMSFWLQVPDFKLLYANLTEEDAAKIVEELKKQKIPYELGARGNAVRVPAGMVHETRLKLATQGLPEGGEVGLEIFEKTPLGMTEFIQKLNFQRALQGELTRTIKSLEAVETARIHLVIPKDTLFLKDKPKGKASVVLKIRNGRSLTQEQVQGIVHLVASSVEGIQPQNVVVVDVKGNILSGANEGPAKAHIASSNFKHRMNVEKALESKILKMLENALGPGKVITRVSADLDLERVEQTEEIFDPDSQVVRSQQVLTESTKGAVPPGGISGVQSLTPTGEAPPGVPGSAASKDRENQTLNYEINKVLKHISKPVGQIKKLSISVLIDGKMTGNPPAYQPRTEEEMNTFRDIVKTAVGYDEARGDQIKVENVQFDKSLMEEQTSRMRQEEQIDMGITAAKYLLAFIFVFLFFARVIRPVVNWMTTSVEVVEEGMLPPSEEEAIEEEKKRLEALGTQAQELRQAVGDFVQGDPKFSAGVIRRWLKER